MVNFISGAMVLAGIYFLGRTAAELATGIVCGEDWKKRRVELLIRSLARFITGAVLLTAGLARFFRG